MTPRNRRIRSKQNAIHKIFISCSNHKQHKIKPRASAPSHGVWVTSTSEGAEAHGGSLCSAKRSPGPQQPGGYQGPGYAAQPAYAPQPAQPSYQAPVPPAQPAADPGPDDDLPF